MTFGEYTLPEITTQGESWACALDAAKSTPDMVLEGLRQSARDAIVFIGCGSTYYLAQFAAAYFGRATGIGCRALPSSELLLQTEAVVPPDARPMIVALSRSGRTSETIEAVAKMRARGCQALAVSCHRDTALSAKCGHTLEVAAGREESFAQTRSFAGMLVAVQGLAARVAGSSDLGSALDKLPDLAPALVDRARTVAESLGPDGSIERITYLGSGELYGLAGEAMIKMKEMSLSIAEAFHFMEFRHGPMALVDSHHLCVALLSERTRRYELSVLNDLKQRDARILTISEGDSDVPADLGDRFPLRSGLPELARPVLYLPLVQYFAYYRALARGLNPDRPRNVVMAIELDGSDMKS